jgi:lysophospholipase L1-like esterase
VKASGEEASWYASLVPRDIHFSAKGNRWMADWLAPRLAAALRLRP